MLNEIRTFFDHSRHGLEVEDVDAPLDVLAFEGKEALSQPFHYSIEFTSSNRDISAEAVLGKAAAFSLNAPPPSLTMRGYTPPAQPPLRTLHGVITQFRRLSASRDEAHYEVVLEPRLALLRNNIQYRIFQQMSVPEVIEKILREGPLHFRGQDLLIDLARKYPDHEQLLQYGESDLAYLQRLSAERGLWFRFETDSRLRIEVLRFHDSQRFYERGRSLSLRPMSGMESSGQDAVWGLQVSYQVVQARVSTRAYYSRDAGASQDAHADLARGASTTHGEAYHYADEPYKALGDALAHGDEDDYVESGFFFAKLAHERYLNNQTRLSGVSSCAALAPGQVLEIEGDAPQAFARGALIVGLRCRAARDCSYELHFDAIPNSDTVGFRPAVPPKPRIAGTVPARVTSPTPNDIYGHIDAEGRYRVNFLFDRDTWPAGKESMWLRQARPYAGENFGFHLPLLAGTEVAIAFEQGDPDRPYIAHALHDNLHPDHVTIRNYKRNILRSPANNKILLDDTRGQEHIKLSTEHSGKSQLNLGHLVDNQRQRRGEGFELRTDGWGALRAGKGVFISADEQPKAQGQVLEMAATLKRLQDAGEQLGDLSRAAEQANADPADVQAQLDLLSQRLDRIQACVALLSAPQGIALASGEHLQLAARRNLMINAGHEADISVVKRFFIGVGEGLSLFVRKVGMKLIVNQGPVTVQAQNGQMELVSRLGLNIASSEDEIHITAKKKITLNAGGTFITLDANSIKSGTQGDYQINAAHFDYQGPASMQATHPDYPKLESRQKLCLNIRQVPNAPALGWPGMPYQLFANGALMQAGVLDSSGEVRIDHEVITSQYRLVLANGISYQLPVPTEYRNAEQAHMANEGLQHHVTQADARIIQPASHTDHRQRYASLLGRQANNVEGEQ